MAYTLGLFYRFSSQGALLSDEIYNQLVYLPYVVISNVRLSHGLAYRDIAHRSYPLSSFECFGLPWWGCIVTADSAPLGLHSAVPVSRMGSVQYLSHI